jgi:hypothetical protein
MCMRVYVRASEPEHCVCAYLRAFK